MSGPVFYLALSATYMSTMSPSSNRPYVSETICNTHQCPTCCCQVMPSATHMSSMSSSKCTPCVYVQHFLQKNTTVAMAKRYVSQNKTKLLVLHFCGTFMLHIPKLVSWCFEPSHPQRITSGLKTNMNLSPG